MHLIFGLDPGQLHQTRSGRLPLQIRSVPELQGLVPPSAACGGVVRSHRVGWMHGWRQGLPSIQRRSRPQSRLHHANRVLGFEAFRKSEWTVKGDWNAAAESHDQYLVPLQDVAFEGQRFEIGKRILVVRSFKYNNKQKTLLWKAAGLIEKARWTNPNGSYGESPTSSCCPTLSATALT